MGMQFLVRAPSVEAVSAALGELADCSEIFPVSAELIGVSVPTKAVNVMGEDFVLASLRHLPTYELWSGEWHVPT